MHAGAVRHAGRAPPRPIPVACVLVACCVVACAAAASLPAAEPPGTVAELWADFDPRQDPLEVEVIREWNEAGGTFRHVRYLVGTFKGTPARMTAI